MKFLKNTGIFLGLLAVLVGIFFLSRWLTRSEPMISSDGSRYRVAADRSFQARDWDAAIANYQSMLDADPFNPTAHFQKSRALHMRFKQELVDAGLDKPETKQLANEAIASYLTTLDYPHLRSRVHYNLAAIYAGTGEPQQALDELEAAIDLGISPGRVANDSDFEVLRQEPRFQELIKGVSNDPDRLGVIRR